MRREKDNCKIYMPLKNKLVAWFIIVERSFNNAWIFLSGRMFVFVCILAVNEHHVISSLCSPLFSSPLLFYPLISPPLSIMSQAVSPLFSSPLISPLLPTHSLTHSRTDPLTNLLTQTHQLTHQQTYLLNNLPHLPTNPLTHLLTHSFTY